MAQVHWMVSLVRIATILFVLLGCFVLFLYSPFYSQLVVKGLNYFVPVDVNEVAAESQKAAALSEHENLEPGSNLWIARQAYLKLMEKTFESEKPEDLRLIQARYKLLQQTIIDEQEKEEQKEKKNNIPLLNQKAEQDQDSSAVVISSTTDFLQGNTPDNQALMGKYLAFLETYPVALPVNEDEKDETNKDLVELKKNKDDGFEPKNTSQPYAIVVLGGGLTLAENG